MLGHAEYFSPSLHKAAGSKQMANLHTPERQPDESMQDYRLRRAASHAAVRSMRAVGMSGGQTSREKQRSVKRNAGTLRGTFGASLIAMWASKRRDAIHKANGHAQPAWTFVGREVASVIEWDEHGVPITGGRLMPAGGGVLRRVWLAGISAQRGY